MPSHPRPTPPHGYHHNQVVWDAENGVWGIYDSSNDADSHELSLYYDSNKSSWMTSLGKAWEKLPSAKQVAGYVDTGMKAVDAAS